MSSRSSAVFGAAMLLLTGCSGAALGGETRDVPRAGSNGSIVLHAKQLQQGSTTLLGALRGRLAGMQVESSRSSNCPEITLRGTKSINGGNSPLIYVDGARAVNTCVLDMLPLGDVERVEVYPMGVPPHPPYQAHPNGLILVFLQSGTL